MQILKMLQIILKKIGIAGQKRLLNAKVLIIGIGGLGCPLLTYLAASGVGTIGIIDHDIIEISNLSRQVLFTKRDIGKKKVVIAKKVIKNMNLTYQNCSLKSVKMKV